MEPVKVNFSGDGTTYVSLLYGESTDYCTLAHGIGTSKQGVIPGDPPESCDIAVTNIERAKSLPDVVGFL